MRTRTLLLALGTGAGAALGLVAWLGRGATTDAVTGPAPAGRPRLVRTVGGTVRRGEAASRGLEDEVLLTTGRLVVGRSAASDLRLHEATVSLQHAELEVDPDGHVLVRDLGSQNGVLVDGVPIAQVQLHDGNRVEIGDVVMVFKSDLALGAPGRQGGELG